MPRNIRWGALVGIAALVLLLQAGPGQAQIRCDWCRVVPCPDAPMTSCIDIDNNETTCYNVGICFPVEYFKVTPPGQAAAGTASASLLQALQCPAAATPSVRITR